MSPYSKVSLYDHANGISQFIEASLCDHVDGMSPFTIGKTSNFNIGRIHKQNKIFQVAYICTSGFALSL